MKRNLKKIGCRNPCPMNGTVLMDSVPVVGTALMDLGKRRFYCMACTSSRNNLKYKHYSNLI